MSSQNIQKKRISGNALFLILIAVALFAALAYAVTQSGRGGGSSGREQSTLAAAQIVQYVEQIRRVVVRLQTLNGCTSTELNFDSNLSPTPLPWPDVAMDANANRRADGACDVFAGGDITAPSIPASAWSDPVDHGFRLARVPVQDIGVNPANAADPAGIDTILLAWRVNAATCQALRSGFGISSGTLPEAGYFLDWLAYDESSADSAAHAIGDASDPALRGHPDGCYLWSTATGEHDGYFTVVVR